MRRIASFIAALLLGAVIIVVTFFDDIVLAAITPAEPFDPAALPAPPDYNLPLAWTALPTVEDAADAFIPELPAIDQRKAAADVFYVHPTTYVGPRWNGPIDDGKLNSDTDRVATRIQASAFNGCCAIWGPRYRQANGSAFTHPTAERARAVDVAYSDVRRAFRHFLSQRDPARPFILASHSQGSVLAYRLLKEEISGKPLRSQLVAAWLIGSPITEDMVVRDLPDIPPCGAPEQVGCLIAWNARAQNHRPGVFEFRVLTSEGVVMERPGKRLCVNPLSWRHDEAAVEARRSAGAVFLDAQAPLFARGFTGAECRAGTLVVAPTGRVPRDFMSRLLDHALGAGNYHPVEFQLFFADIRSNASVRLAAWSPR